VLRGAQIDLHLRSAERRRRPRRSETRLPPTAIDAVVAALASCCPDPTVLTGDPSDLAALAEHPSRPVAVSGV
jgi:hypothetical protein